MRCNCRNCSFWFRFVFPSLISRVLFLGIETTKSRKRTSPSTTNNFVNAFRPMWWWTVVDFLEVYSVFFLIVLFNRLSATARKENAQFAWYARREIAYSAMSGVSHLWITSRSVGKKYARKWIWHNKNVYRIGERTAMLDISVRGLAQSQRSFKLLQLLWNEAHICKSRKIKFSYESSRLNWWARAPVDDDSCKVLKVSGKYIAIIMRRMR